MTYQDDGLSSVLDLDDLAQTQGQAEDEENDSLVAPARGTSILLPDWDPIDDSADVPKTEVEEAIWALLEGAYTAKKFDPVKHPRWPKGTPRGGEFIRVGEHFLHGGKRWEVISTVGGKVEAAEASGDVKSAEHKTFETTEAALGGGAKGRVIKGIEHAPPKKIVGGAYAEAHAGGENSTVVDPYVKPETHNPEIPIPAGSKLTAEEWTRFGEGDQLYYTELMGRFGDWKASQADGIMQSAYNAYEASIQHVIDTALGHQYSGGYWGTSHYGGEALNLAYLFRSVGAGGPQLEAAWAKYEKAKQAWEDINEVLHWDLYNRTRSPDIVLMHGGTTPLHSYQSEFIGGKKAIYAGWSQSWNLPKASSWGDTVMMTPVAIKHVGMSIYTRPGHAGGSYSGEEEIAIGRRVKLDDHSVAFQAQHLGMSGYAATEAVRKWLAGETSGQPTGGKTVETLKDIWAGKEVIPIPEEPPGLAPISESGSSYSPLPGSIAQKASGMVAGLKFKDPENTGNKEGAVGILESMGLKPGDFIEGKKGTRYVVIADSADAHGMRYVKVADSSGNPVPIDYGSKSWGFSASQGNEFYRLDGHIDIPEKKAVGFTPFTQEQYDKLGLGEKSKPLSQFQPDEMFQVDGKAYKVIGPHTGGKIKVQALDTGQFHSANGLHKPVPLVPKEGYTPPTPEPEFKEGQLISAEGFLARYSSQEGNEITAISLITGETITAPASDTYAVPDIHPAEAKVGDIFAFEGKKFVVTNVMKDGTVKAKQPGGHVQAFTKIHPALDGLFRINDHVIGDKVKAHTLLPGDVVSNSGAKQHPHLVVGTVNNKVALLNLETGEPVTSTKQKSWFEVKHPPVAELDKLPDEPKQPAGEPEGKLPDLVPVPGKAKTFAAMDIGEKFIVPQTGGIWEKTKETSGTLVVPGTLADYQKPGLLSGFDNSSDGKTWQIVEPKESKPSHFDITSYTAGTPMKVGDMPEGQIFQSANGIPMKLKSKTPKGGATAIALHNGKLVKNIPYDKPLKPLEEKHADIPYDQLAGGDVTTLGNLKVGDQFGLGEFTYQLLETPGADQHPTVAEVKGGTGGFELGPKAKLAVVGETPVTFFYHGGEPVLVPETPDPQTLDNAGMAGFEPYLHPKSGKTKHPKISTLTEGQVFQDKSGTIWKVKLKLGSSTMITDGEKHYLASSSDYVKLPPPDATWYVPDGPPATDPTASPVQKAAAEGLHENVEGRLLSDLNLKTGDQFKTPSGVYTVKPAAGMSDPYQPDHVYAEDESGLGAYYPLSYEPDAYKLQTVSPPSADDEPKYGLKVSPSAEPTMVTAQQYVDVVKQFDYPSNIKEALGHLTPAEVEAIGKQADATPGVAAHSVGLAAAEMINAGAHGGKELTANEVKAKVDDLPIGATFQPASGGIVYAKTGEPGGGINISGPAAQLGDTTDFEGYTPDLIDKDSHDALADDKPTVGDLKKGDQFTIPAGYSGSGKQYEVVDTTPNEVGPLPATYGMAEVPGYTTITVKPPGEPDSVATQIATDLKPDNIVPAANKSPRNTVKVDQVKDLDVGDTYEVPAHGMKWQVMGKLPNGGVHMKALAAPDPGEVGMETNLSPGSIGPLQVTKHAPPSKSFGDLAVGDHFEAQKDLGQGTWKKVSPTKAQLVAKPKGSTQLGSLGDTFEMTGTPGAPGVDVTPADAPETPTWKQPIEPFENPLVPYLHPKGGKIKHTKIGKLTIGQTFTDKAKKTYTVKGHHGAHTAFTDESNNTYMAPKDAWVKAGVPPTAGEVFDSAPEKKTYPKGGGEPVPVTWKDWPLSMQIDGYPSSWTTGGHYKYPSVSQVAIGTKVKPKVGGVFTVADYDDFGALLKNEEDGTYAKVPSDLHVQVLT